MKLLHTLIACGLLALGATTQKISAAAAAKPTPAVTNTTAAQIIFHGTFPQTKPEEKEEKLIYSAKLSATIEVQAKQYVQTHNIKVQVLQGELKELQLTVTGTGNLTNVTGTGVAEWGIKRNAKGERVLVVVADEKQKKLKAWNLKVSSQFEFGDYTAKFSPLVLAPRDAALYDGQLDIKSVPEVQMVIYQVKALDLMEKATGKATEDHYQYRFSSEPYSLNLSVRDADPERRVVHFSDFNLTGTIKGDVAAFTLTGNVSVRHPEGGLLEVLSGAVALTDYKRHKSHVLNLHDGRYRLKLETNGTFPLEIKFDAQIIKGTGWNRINFLLPPSTLRPILLHGLPADTQVKFIEAAEAKREGDTFASALPSSGALNFQWQEAKPEVEGKLFYSVTGAGQIAVGPGLIRQTTQLDFKVMQGELRELVVQLTGEGEVTRVDGKDILTWKIESAAANQPRQLRVQLNQAQKGDYGLTVFTQTSLGAFPLKVKPLRLVPDGAIRYGGHLRVVNDGAVRLEATSTPGLAQISPAFFPVNKSLGAISPQQQAQAFAFRFSGQVFDLELQADNILPELTVSALMRYHLGETETQIEAEMELDIREAPLREFIINVPNGYQLSQVNAPSLSDYSLTAGANNAPASLKLQFGQPLIGRQVVFLRLTASHDSPPATWTLPPIRPQQVKSLRGFVGISADAGLRLTEAQSDGLTEIATAFFPKQIKELQLAYRLRDEAWQATAKSERLALSIQSDSLHLFTLAEGIAYGSTLVNYLIAGAPVGVLKVEVPTNYSNVEFVGQDIRNWNPIAGGYEIHLHTPVSGTYSLAATYDVQFKSGDTLPFTGLRPLEVQSEQGYLIVVSSYQFKTEPAELSPGLIPLEPGEIPVEYRLLYDAPMLAAYQFTARPFQVRMKLTSMSQGETLSQVVDRATYRTRVSSEGQALTDAIYLIKSKGNSHLRITVPEDVTLWSARVNGREVVPVVDGKATLIPLPANVSPNQIIPLALKLATKSGKETEVRIALPQVEAPLLLAEWQVSPDLGYQLRFEEGNLMPNKSAADVSGFAWIGRMIDGAYGRDSREMLLVGLLSLLLGAGIWRWVTTDGNTRFSLKNSFGALVGVAACILTFVAAVTLINKATGHPLTQTPALDFTIPVQSAGNALAIQIENQSLEDAVTVWSAWPAILALFVWGYSLVSLSRSMRSLGIALGWICVFWGCLSLPNGADEFFVATLVFISVHVILPLLMRQFQLPRPVKQTPAPAAAAMLIGGLMFLNMGACTADAAGKVAPPANSFFIPNAVIQIATVKEDQVFVKAKLHWNANKDQALNFLNHPAVMTDIKLPKDSLVLSQAEHNRKSVYRLTATKDGVYDVEFSYEISVTNQKGVRGFHLPTLYGLINRLTLDLDRAEVEITTANAISIRPLTVPKADADKRSSFELVLSPQLNPLIAWKPRGRDTRSEKTVFFAELQQLYVPAAGIIEGVHDAHLRLAQGQITDLTFTTPLGMTITDVTATGLANWRFDPDERKLRLQYQSPQSQNFSLRIHSQFTTGPLPFEKELGMIQLEQSAGQIGMAGIATGTEVQMAGVTVKQLTTINLEDFPASIIKEESKRVAGLTLRRAYRYGQATATLTISAAAVQPDIRVNTSQTLSLGEDRTVLAANIEAAITRAGVFKLSFALPPGMDPETLSGPALSHWTELETDGVRVITLHLKGKTEGVQQFSITLAGPGVPGTNTWAAPRLSIRESDKQVGQLVVVPEQGMRLRVDTREGLNQLDPKKAGINQRGVMVFRLLHANWRLAFEIKKVDPWIQVTSLQGVTIREGQTKVSATLDYKIENAGLKSLFVELPANADAVRFTGDLVADALRSTTGNTNEWEIKLQRRVIGGYKLQVAYQIVSAAGAQETLRSLKAARVDLHRGYLTLNTGGRLQINIPTLPASLQPGDWQSIPANLRQGSTTEANFTFRVIEPDFQLPLNVVRHDAAKLLPARVEKSDLMSVLSDSGVMLTSVKLSMHPGDKRLLRFTLPSDARFWFAFVNQASAWPWREGEEILVPLEPPTRPGQPITVEFFYSSKTSVGKRGSGKLQLLGPKFDLPLENISWNIFLPAAWNLEDWDTKLQLQQMSGTTVAVNVDLQSFINAESTQQQQKIREAEGLLKMGNQYLAEGRQKQARQAYSSAFNLSQHDNAFNEDARVQLQKLKMQQAIVGLNYRRHAVTDEKGEKAAAKQNAGIEILSAGTQPVYTQQQVKKALDQNSAEDNATLARLAEHLVEQQEAAGATPEAIQSSFPEHGTKYTFTRSLQVDKWADLSIKLETSTPSATTWSHRALMLGTLLIGALIFMAIARRREAA